MDALRNFSPDPATWSDFSVVFRNETTGLKFRFAREGLSHVVRFHCCGKDTDVSCHPHPDDNTPLHELLEGEFGLTVVPKQTVCKPAL